MAKFFIERPIFAIVLSIVITVVGLISAFNLPIAQYPQISPPTIGVSTSYMGANAEVVDQTVAQIIEQQMNGVEDMVSMSSTSSDNGSYSLSIQFESGKDADIAAVQAQNRVSQANPSLPTDVQTAGVTTRKSTQDMAMIIALTSPNGTYDSIFLKNYGSIYLLDDIKRVKGVGNVMEFGSDYAMRIWLQPDKMARLGITTTDVSNAISKQNIQVPSGALGQSPSAPTQQFQYSTRMQGRLTEKEDFESIIVRSQSDGSFVRIKDIATVELGSKDYSFGSELNGMPTVGFAIQLSSDANALQTISNVRKVIADAATRFPADMEYKIPVDNTEYVRESMLEVCKTLAEALGLVLLVVFIFLQSWRATLIPILAIPVSLIGTFGAFWALGFSINTLTLFAMVLAIGLVVDDAIVVIEAVEHHMRYNGLSPHDATSRAMSEVSGPVIAIAFVLASVFLPVAFFGGTMGILYKQFALTIAVSMALSAIVALSLTPALCALLLKPYSPQAHQGNVGKFFERFNQWFERTIERYGSGLTGAIHKAKLWMALLGVLLILAGGLYRVVPSSFVPSEDQGYFITAVNLPEAATLDRSNAVVHKVAEEIRSHPGVNMTMAVSGFDLMGGGTKSNAAAIFTNLKPWAERRGPELQIQSQVMNVLMSGAHLPEATVIALNPPSLPGLGMVGGFTFMLEDRTGASIDEIDRVSKEFLAAAKKRSEIGAISTTFSVDTPGYEFKLDREKAEKLGVSVSDVSNALQAFLGGLQVNDFNRFGRTYKVILQASPQYRSDAEAMRFFFLKSANGTMVPLNTLVKAEPVNAPTVLTRFNGSRAVQFNGSPSQGYSSGQAMTALEEVAAQTLPSGFGYEWSGQSREEKLSGSRTPIVFGMALFFVFLCLAALYESWSIPLAVIFCVPVGIFGAFLFQCARNLENSIYMQIGLVMLIGLAAKNAILIVEFAKIRVDRGMNPVQAAIEAAKLRLRPILMTSLAFIIGCLPLAYASGAGAGARNTMGTTVVGGMLLATGVGIFLIPVLFVVIERLTEKLHRRRKEPVGGQPWIDPTL
ncbi:MAG: multidrug efflux RND transporter permease subunit [Negativicutes bacterium]|nr:multidrug efflux RND transporter permease subunit [Negativicutes bacterium]